MTDVHPPPRAGAKAPMARPAAAAPAAVPTSADLPAYSRDLWERSVLFLDTLGQRADNMLAHERAGMPPALDFKYEIVLDARRFDPPAGHGPGIGGFKRDSEIGMAMHQGQLNRLIFANVGPQFLDLAVARLARTGAGAALTRLYRPGPISRLAQPLLGRLSRDPGSALACGEESCGCEWCKCTRPSGTAARNHGRIFR